MRLISRWKFRIAAESATHGFFQLLKIFRGFGQTMLQILKIRRGLGECRIAMLLRCQQILLSLPVAFLILRADFGRQPFPDGMVGVADPFFPAGYSRLQLVLRRREIIQCGGHPFGRGGSLLLFLGRERVIFLRRLVAEGGG